MCLLDEGERKSKTLCFKDLNVLVDINVQRRTECLPWGIKLPQGQEGSGQFTGCEHCWCRVDWLYFKYGNRTAPLFLPAMAARKPVPRHHSLSTLMCIVWPHKRIIHTNESFRLFRWRRSVNINGMDVHRWSSWANSFRQHMILRYFGYHTVWYLAVAESSESQTCD